MTRIAHADKALNINEVARHEPRPACLTAGHALRARHHAPRGRRFYSNEVYAYDGPKHGIIFCGKGRLTKITDGSGNTEFKYDIQGRLIQKKQTTGTVIKTVSYAYDSFGRMNSITYPSGKVLTYGFDGQGRINSMALNGVNLVSAITYQPFGPAKSWLWSSGPVQARAFDLDGRQTSYPYTGAGTVNLTYDLGNRIKNLSGTLAKAYGYDKLDRLTSYSNAVYAYDATGNRTGHTVGATPYAYTYPATSHRLTSFTGPAARSYTYDAAGNTLTTGSGFTFSYDGPRPRGARGRMTNITTGSVNQYGINALGQRLTKVGTGYTGTLRFVYGEDGKLLGEYDNTGAYLIQADHLNTPRAILGAANALVWKWDSDAFGSTAANENPSALGTFNYNPRFPGQYYDKESALHYNYWRDSYNPKTGRYFQSDPIGLKGGINTYGYVGGNPLARFDRDGLLFDGIVNAGESFGDSAAQHWSDLAVQTGNPLYHVPGALASLWTPNTGDSTATTLCGGFAARVLGPFSPRGLPSWLTRPRQYIRFDSPHHNKGWEFDGKIPNAIRDWFNRSK